MADALPNYDTSVDLEEVAMRPWTPIYAAICTSAKMKNLPDDAARLFYLQLLLQCDSYGCHRADSHVLKARVWPLLDKSEAESARALAACTAVGLVVTYQDGERFWLEIPDWEAKAGSHTRRRGDREYGPGDPDQRVGPERCVADPAPSATGTAPSGTTPGVAGTNPAPCGTSPALDIDGDGEILSASPEAPRNNEVPKAKKKATAPLSGLRREAIAAWGTVYWEVVGKQYAFDGAADGKQVKRLLGKPDFAINELRRRARLFLSNPFWAEQGVDLKRFVSQWTALGNAGRKVDEEPPKPAPSQADLDWIRRALDDPQEVVREQAKVTLAGWGITEAELRAGRAGR